MDRFPASLARKLAEREANNALRSLSGRNGKVDFYSNDYLGFSAHKGIHSWACQMVEDRQGLQNGASGSRLLSGNHPFYPQLEQLLEYHYGRPALVFYSGYTANLGFFNAVPQRQDLVFYDEYAHASIRDGIRMGTAKAYKFPHNDMAALEALLHKHQAHGERYIVTETVFSMDGDAPNLDELGRLARDYGCRLVIDEAHAIGVCGPEGKGLLQDSWVAEYVFARIITFGKALGAHGAAVLGCDELRNYLVNFARSFIYTTALPPHALATVIAAYQFLFTESGKKKMGELRENIRYFREELEASGISPAFISSDSAIHCCVIPGNDRVKSIAGTLQREGFDVRPILSPTVPKGKERLRFCLHNYNSRNEIGEVIQLLASEIKE